MEREHITLGFVDSVECRYRPQRGFFLPKVMYKTLEARNEPPFVFYAFLKHYDEFPYVELYDKFGAGSEIFPFQEMPQVLEMKARNRIVLPKNFAAALNLTDRIRIYGKRDMVTLWHPDDYRVADHLIAERTPEEIFE